MEIFLAYDSYFLFFECKEWFFSTNRVLTVPPSSPEIRLPSGQPVYSMVGPYDEGSQLKLICEAAEGNRNSALQTILPQVQKFMQLVR